jgi:CubicO group peptidase (beta-lactamase class C family)
MEKIMVTRFFRHSVLILIITIGILLSGSSVFAEAMWVGSDGITLDAYNLDNIGTIPNNINDLAGSNGLISTKGSTLLNHYLAVGCAVLAFEIDQENVVHIYPTYIGNKRNPGSTSETDKVDENTIFQAGSISKLVSAWGLLEMAEKNWCPTNFLNNPITYYLPPNLGDSGDWSLPTVNDELNASEVTLSQILLHQSGIFQSADPGNTLYNTYRGWTANDIALISNNTNRERIGTTSLRLPLLSQELSGTLKNAGAKLYFQPGHVIQIGDPNDPSNPHNPARFYYSGAGYEVMQKVMENVLRTQDGYKRSEGVLDYEVFNKFMKENVLNGIMVNYQNCTSSSFLYGQLSNPDVDVASGFLNKLFLPYPRTLYTAKAAAGLYTTANDLSNFVNMLIGDLNDNNNGESRVDKIINRDVVQFNGNFCILSNGLSVGFVGKYVGENPDDTANLRNLNGTIISDDDVIAQINKLKGTGYDYNMKHLAGFWGHSGSNTGYKSLIMFHGAIVGKPIRGCGLVVLTNSDTGSGDKVMHDIASAWLATNINQYGDSQQ